MSKSQEIIRDLLNDTNDISDPSGLMADLSTVFDQNEWTREKIARIADEHRRKLEAPDSAS